MNSEPQRPMTGSRPSLQRAHSQGVHYADIDRSLDEVPERFSCAPSDVCGELPADDRTGAPLATQPDAAGTTPASLVQAAIGCRCGEFQSVIGALQVYAPEGSLLPSQWPSRTSAVVPVVSHDARRHRFAPEQHHCEASWAQAAEEPILALPDLPLIVEDLLIGAKQLVDSGAPNESVEALLDHIASLREGRD